MIRLMKRALEADTEWKKPSGVGGDSFPFATGGQNAATRRCDRRWEMFDLFRTRYRFRCPETGESHPVPLSAFRAVSRLPGATAPAVYRVSFECGCGSEHQALVPHDRLDWEPLATETTDVWVNVVTGTRELVSSELTDLAGSLIRQGQWPWMFYCYPESDFRPGFPSSLRAVTPTHTTDETCGVLVRCGSCRRLSINLVTRQHLDVPFFNDEAVRFVPTMVADERVTDEEAFRQELSSTAVDWARRIA